MMPPARRDVPLPDRRALEAELDCEALPYPNRRGATLGRRYFVRRKPDEKGGGRRLARVEDLYALDAALSVARRA